MEFLYFLESIRNSFLDVFFSTITYIGDEIFALALICIIFWCLNKNYGYKLGFSFFASGMIIQALKVTFRIPRPWQIDENFTTVGNSQKAATGYSFPSGHTQCSTTVFSSFAIEAKKMWLKLVCVAIFLLVGLSRMYLGVHTPKDVIVAMVVTLLCVLIFNNLFDKIEDNQKYDGIIAVVLAVISVAVTLYAVILKMQDIIPDTKEYAKNALDCCKTGGAGFGFAIGWYIERRWVKFDVKTEKVWQQIVKLIFGICVALLLKELPKIIFADLIEGSMKIQAIIDTARYVLVTFWVVAGFPAIVMNYKKRRAIKKSN